MIKRTIPAPVIAVVSEVLSKAESHASLDNLFLYADAPGEPPEGSKIVKTQAWLRRINKKTDDPLKILGKLIEGFMEIAKDAGSRPWENPQFSFQVEMRDKIQAALAQYNLSYFPGGNISDGSSIPSKSLAELIKDRDIPQIEIEFTRALQNVNSNPREATSAAGNILESICKVYISEECLKIPSKQDLQNVWKVVKADLGLNPSKLEDNDLKKILTGIFSIVDGIGALRTHASSAHGLGSKPYKLKPRHARLAVHSAHTLALFILETWDEKRSHKSFK